MARPGGCERIESALHLVRLQIALDGRLDARLGDGLRAWRVELGVGGVLPVTEREDDLARLTRLDLEAHVVRADGLPAVGDGVGGHPALDDIRPFPASIWAQEGIALGIEAGQRLTAGEPGEVVATLPVLGLVIDDTVLDLDLTDRVVALEVGGVVVGVPEAPLHCAEERQVGGLRTFIGDASAPDLERFAIGYEVGRFGVDAVGA